MTVAGALTRLPPTELNFAKTHGILFSGKQNDDLESTTGRFLALLDNHIDRSARRWLEPGYYIDIANICALNGYGGENIPIASALKITSSQPNAESESQDQPMQEGTTPRATAVASIDDAVDGARRGLSR
ncbi:uncharacterized protein B0T15DRAFT_576313 [Chaetomium strumarium]|uniref:Uncharacterized protein n=1 Tax=Chaetomium strumarium TaxID=1170767 RepID=A0AAJ0GMR3_9PEZI|nr:hypothetical protein B0T15DRAFT_576313 [Chaetomium strumarium]